MTTTAIKLCVNCGKDVTNDKRMRDSSGKYWCIACGQEDQLKKRATAGGASCSGCGGTFADHQLSVWGNKKLCTKCSVARSKGPGLGATIGGLFKGSAGGSGGESNKRKTAILLLVMVLLAAVALYANLR